MRRDRGWREGQGIGRRRRGKRRVWRIVEDSLAREASFGMEDRSPWLFRGRLVFRGGREQDAANFFPPMAARALGFIQFLIVGLGVFALHMMVKLGASREQPELIAQAAPLFARYGLWFFLVPILWAAFVGIVGARMEKRTLVGIGLAVTGLLFLVIGVPLAFYLR